jgi:hypothetical protein
MDAQAVRDGVETLKIQASQVGVAGGTNGASNRAPV